MSLKSNADVSALRRFQARLLEQARDADSPDSASGITQSQAGASTGSVATDYTTASVSDGSTIHIALYDLDTYDNSDAIYA